MNITEANDNYIDAFDDFYRKFAPFVYLSEKVEKKSDNIFSN